MTVLTCVLSLSVVFMMSGGNDILLDCVLYMYMALITIQMNLLTIYCAFLTSL